MIPDRKTIAVSAVILFMLSIQAAASFGLLGHRFWPFMNYPMYKKAHYEGEAVDHYVMKGVFRDGTETVIAPEQIGLSFWKFLYGPLRKFIDGDQSALKEHLDNYRLASRPELRSVRVENHALSITADGLSQKPVVVIGAIRLD